MKWKRQRLTFLTDLLFNAIITIDLLILKRERDFANFSERWSYTAWTFPSVDNAPERYLAFMFLKNHKRSRNGRANSQGWRTVVKMNAYEQPLDLTNEYI
jgi:hypothetical protein